MPYGERFEEALLYATRLHRDQTRKGTEVPYVTHLLAVAAIVGENGGTEDEVVAALLHDAPEDRGGKERLEEIRARFGDEVAEIVDGCTDTYEDPKPEWRPRKEAYIAHVAEASPSVRLVSAADKLHNARSILADLRALGDELWDRFTGGKEGTLWYYRALVEAYAGAGSNPVVEELDRVVREIEHTVRESTSKPRGHQGSRSNVEVKGLDFTSKPGARKPIFLMECELQQEVLYARNYESLQSFEELERFLSQEGAWIAGIDFPFGQPKQWVLDLGWPDSWEAYVKIVADMPKEDFETAVRQYSQIQREGNRLPKRSTDRRAGAQPPMKLDFIPVGKMFFQGAPRLLKSDLSIQPCRPTDNARTVIEAYPALVARKFVDRTSYKNDNPTRQTSGQRGARKEILRGVRSLKLKDWYGFSVKLDEDLAEELVEDGTGDKLDSLLCAIQAAWAYTRREENYGVPETCDPDEGCIIDPQLLCRDSQEP